VPPQVGQDDNFADYDHAISATVVTTHAAGFENQFPGVGRLDQCREYHRLPPF
jgi:hypothetical protein